MSFKKGRSYRVFITLENSNAAICATGTSPSLITASASLSSFGANGVATSTIGIGGLGSVVLGDPDSSVLHEIKNLTGIEPAPTQIDAPFEIFGQTRQLDNPIRKDWKLTLTRKCETKLFNKLFSEARFGAIGSGTTAELFDGLSTYPDTVGFRLYVYDDDTQQPWDIFYHGTIDPTSYKLTLSPTGVTEEQIVFAGGKWKPALETSSTDLTASESITQA